MNSPWEWMADGMTQTRDSVCFTVPGTPKSQPRPRVSKNGGVFNPKSADAYKACCQLAASQAMQSPLDGPVYLSVVAVFPRPQKRNGRKHQSDGRYRHTQKPDADNVLKAIKDALNGIAWQDDKQVCELRMLKWVAADSEQPHTEIQLFQL